MLLKMLLKSLGISGLSTSYTLLQLTQPELIRPMMMMMMKRIHIASSRSFVQFLCNLMSWDLIRLQKVCLEGWLFLKRIFPSHGRIFD